MTTSDPLACPEGGCRHIYVVKASGTLIPERWCFAKEPRSTPNEVRKREPGWRDQITKVMVCRGCPCERWRRWVPGESQDELRELREMRRVRRRRALRNLRQRIAALELVAAEETEMREELAVLLRSTLAQLRRRATTLAAQLNGGS